MKKALMVLALGALIAGEATAQDKHRSDNSTRHERRQGLGDRKSPEEIADRQAEMLDKKLDLSNKQERKVREASLKRAQELQTLHNRVATERRQNRKAMRQERQSIHEHWEKEIEDILSKKQYARYETMGQEMRSRRLAREDNRNEKGEKRNGFRRQQRDNR